MKACVKSMVAALTALSDGSAIMPVRQVVRLPIKSKVGVLAAGEKSNLAENLARGHCWVASCLLEGVRGEATHQCPLGAVVCGA